MQDVFVGRQPIYGRQLELVAYELLFRGSDIDFADFEEGDRATSQVLLNTFTEFGIERIVGAHRAFVNLTRGFLVGEYPLPVPHQRVVLEVLEDIRPDEEVLAGIRALKSQGFQIALDDFVYHDGYESLIELADILKVDVLGVSDDDIRARVLRLAPFKKQLLAEKIETRAQFEVCLRAGFDFFQGYFLARPNVVQGSGLPASRLLLLRLLAELQDPACSLERVQEIVSQDVTLSYKLLRHINAAAFGMPRRIESIQETVVYLGLTTVKSLASLFLLSSVEDQPHELVVTAMLRARMCEALASAANLGEPQIAFTVGLFSTLEVLLGAPMSSILSRLPLTEDLRDALVDGRGPLGEVLKATLAYERGDWENVRCLGLSKSSIRSAFLDAVAWVDGVDRELAKLAA